MRGILQHKRQAASAGRPGGPHSPLDVVPSRLHQAHQQQHRRFVCHTDDYHLPDMSQERLNNAHITAADTMVQLVNAHAGQKIGVASDRGLRNSKEICRICLLFQELNVLISQRELFLEMHRRVH
jgi:hypothetical protein